MLPFGRQLGVEAHVGHVLGQALGVLGELGDRHEAVDDHESGRDQAGLEITEAPPVGVQGHEAQRRLVPEDRHGHDLHLGCLGRLDRGDHRSIIGVGCALTEEVDDGDALRCGDRFEHASSLGSRPRGASVGP